jgi:nucleoside-diphosphate-sugar epimerase
MKILITGGNGFLGSSLVRFFLNQHNILVISKNSNNLLDIIDLIQFTNHFDEITIKSFQPDIVIHCAWDGGNNYNDVNNFDQILKNIPLSIELLKIISNLENKPKFIGFGTFVEYGLLNQKAKETDQENPINLYGVSKNNFKHISKVFCEQNNIPWTWIRPCYVYGPGDVSTRLIPSIINKLITQQEIVLNSCNTTIDYLYINDFCSAINKIIEYNLTGIYNVCSGNEYELTDIIEFIFNNISPNKKPIFNPELDRKYSSKYICGSNKKLILTTDWKNNIDVQKGLLQTIKFYKDKYETLNNN